MTDVEILLKKLFNFVFCIHIYIHVYIYGSLNPVDGEVLHIYIQSNLP